MDILQNPRTETQRKIQEILRTSNAENAASYRKHPLWIQRRQ